MRRRRRETATLKEFQASLIDSTLRKQARHWLSLSFSAGRKDTQTSLRYKLSNNQTKLLDERIMKLVTKCCAAMPSPHMITVFVGVDGDGFITQFGLVIG